MLTKADLALAAECVRHGAVTVVTGNIEAITVIQLDGDIITRISNVEIMPAHQATIRARMEDLAAMRARLENVGRIRLPAGLAAQLWWLIRAIRLIHGHVLPDVWFLGEVLGGLFGAACAYQLPRLLATLVGRYAVDAVSGRPAPP